MSSQIRRSVVVIVLVVASSCMRSSPANECTGTEPRLEKSGTLTVAIDVTVPPFAYRKPDGTPVGFEVDLARGIARELGLELLLVNRGTSELVTGLVAHRHDVAISALRDTEALRTEACISNGYFEADLGVLVAQADQQQIGDIGHLEGRRVGVVDGSRADRWADRELDGSRLASVPTTDDLLLGLDRDEIDAAVEELAVARFVEAKRSDRYAVAFPIDTGERFVVAAAKDNGGLIATVNRALGTLRRDGKIAKLRSKWFGG